MTGPLAGILVVSVEAIDHPQLAARGRWHPVDTPGGPVEALLPPATISRHRPRMDPVPSLGEHTETILAELADQLT